REILAGPRPMSPTRPGLAWIRDGIVIRPFPPSGKPSRRWRGSAGGTLRAVVATGASQVSLERRNDVEQQDVLSASLRPRCIGQPAGGQSGEGCARDQDH